MVGGDPPESPRLLVWGWEQGQSSRCPKTQTPSLTFSVELVRNLLNEPASVKVDEVRLGRVEREFRLSLGARRGKAPSTQPPCWLSPRVGLGHPFPPFISPAVSRPDCKPQLCH